MTRPLACLSLCLAMVMTGANVPIGKIVVASLTVSAFAVLRFLAASVLLAILSSRESGPGLASLDRRDWRDVVAMALLGMVLYTVFILEGVRRTSSADAGIILAALPAVVALLGAVVLRERVGWPQGVAVALAAGGIGLILTQGTGGTGGSGPGGVGIGPGSRLTGDALVGAAVLGEAAFVLLSRRLSRVLSPVRLALAGSLTACALSLPLALMTGDLGRLADVSPRIWALAGWYTLSASVLCLMLWYRGVGHVETWMAGICTACLPLSALVVSVVFLGEPLSSAQLAGAALVLLAIGVGSLAGHAASPRHGGHSAIQAGNGSPARSAPP